MMLVPDMTYRGMHVKRGMTGQLKEFLVGAGRHSCMGMEGKNPVLEMELI
jgi:hypothetical protein